MMIDDDENDDDDVDQPTVDAGHDKGFAGNVETPAATFSSHHLSIPVLPFFTCHLIILDTFRPFLKIQNGTVKN